MTIGSISWQFKLMKPDSNFIFFPSFAHLFSCSVRQMMLTIIVLFFFVAIRTTLSSAIVKFRLSHQDRCVFEVTLVVQHENTYTCDEYNGKLFSSVIMHNIIVFLYVQGLIGLSMNTDITSTFLLVQFFFTGFILTHVLQLFLK